MKKLFIIAALFMIYVSAAVCQDAAKKQDYKYPLQEANIYYKNVTVYKVLDHKDAYIVMYQKGHRDVGTVTLPKKWYKDRPSKLSLRPLSKGMSPYMTVITREGNFERVILTVPTERSSATWGTADSNQEVDKDKDTLDIVY